MESQYISMIVWFFITIPMLLLFYFRGKKALSIFPKLERVNVLFREKWASGYSNQSWKTKLGGAQNLLEVVITESELWLKGPVIVAGVGEHYDLIHRLKIEEIKSVEFEENNKFIRVTLNNDFSGPFTLQLKKRKEFLEILKSKLAEQ